MKRAKNVWLSVLGLALTGAGICLIKTVPDPQGIMRALPFLLVGFGCGILGLGWGIGFGVGFGEGLGSMSLPPSARLGSSAVTMARRRSKAR